MPQKFKIGLIFPGIALLLVTFVYPLLMMVIPTFFSSSSSDGYVSFLSNQQNQLVIFRTVTIALIATLIILVMGIPTSIWLSKQLGFKKTLLMTLVVFPILTNGVVRNYAWITILGNNGIVNNLLKLLHLTQESVPLLYTDGSIVVGIVYLFLPIMIITLIGESEKLDPELDNAALMLGTRPAKIFWKVTIPQLTTGIITGVTLVFVGALTAYTTPQILGGNRRLVMSTLLYQQAMTLGNWQSASVIATVMIVIALIVTLLLRQFQKRVDKRR
ncbi:ABC transporter permease [Oenococcus sp.]|uniref:ABC transporter permease n=1 Tax=Oenococcus sp. TaxID=1979414 RepID=UPI0039EC6798